RVESQRHVSQLAAPVGDVDCYEPRAVVGDLHRHALRVGAGPERGLDSIRGLSKALVAHAGSFLSLVSTLYVDRRTHRSNEHEAQRQSSRNFLVAKPVHKNALSIEEPRMIPAATARGNRRLYVRRWSSGFSLGRLTGVVSSAARRRLQSDC